MLTKVVIAAHCQPKSHAITRMLFDYSINHKIRNVEPNIRLSRIRVICVLFLSAHCFRLPRTHSADVIQNGIYHITVCHVNWQVSLWLFDGFLCAHFMKQSTTIVKGNVSRRNIMSIINGRYTAQRHTREEPTKMRGKKWKSRWVHHNATNVDENQISFVEKRDNSLAIIILPTRRYADYAFVKPYTQSQPTQIYLNRHTHTHASARTRSTLKQISWNVKNGAHTQNCWYVGCENTVTEAQKAASAGKKWTI